MKEVVIVSMARTPIGNLSGALSGFSAVQLGTHAIKHAVERSGISPEHIQEVFMGNVLQANTGQAPARQAAIAAGIPYSVPCTTVNKVCSSGMKSIMLAAQAIKAGDIDVAVAGGMESMTNAPHMLPAMRGGIGYGNGKVVDAIVRDGLQDPYDGQMMGNCGEVCAEGRNITREEQDKYSALSYERGRAAADSGKFADEIAAIEIPQRRKDPIVFDRDEELNNKRIEGYESLAKLRAVFKKDGGTITAGNASKINDGGAAVVLMSAEKAAELGVKPLARIVSMADAAQEPVWFTTTPAIAMKHTLDKAGKSFGDVDLYEINEAFAVVALANAKELDLNIDKVNVNGGAVALGHPIGVSGCRIVMSLISALKQNDGKLGLAGICNGGGGASSILIERL